MKGVSDILRVLADGRFIAKEREASGLTPESGADRFLANMNRRGNIGGYVRSLDELGSS
jgi:hypothetical protein